MSSINWLKQIDSASQGIVLIGNPIRNFIIMQNLGGKVFCQIRSVDACLAQAMPGR